MKKQQFKAESKRLLDLMINSIYTHKEIFLREIISNASDAIDKLAYISLTDDKVGLTRGDFGIEITVDKEHRILTVTDNGIGMDKDDLSNNLGTIAASGSNKFKQELEEGADVDIIGQFGVGFYSAFMVSDAITVVTRKYGEQTGYMWQSMGADGYTVTECEREACGTDVIMKLKDDTEDENYSEFLETYKLRSLVKKYSDYIRYPIKMDVEKSRMVEGTEDEPKYETYLENETMNSMVPIWQRARSEVSDDEYTTFYRDKFFDYTPPAAIITSSVEGSVSFKALIFIPAQAPMDYYTKDYEKGLQLYSSGVMIMEKCQDLLPDYFRFVRGVVDSQDLSLNISRELLQHDRQLKTIAASIEKKIKSELTKLMTGDREKYNEFFKSFGLQLKYGIVSDYGMHKELLQDLLVFASSAGDETASFIEYLDRMPEDQQYIYYAAGDSVKKTAALPQTELILDKGYEILYFVDDIDEFVVQTMTSYSEKQFKSINSEDLGLETDDEKQQDEDYKELLDFVKECLGDNVKSVRLSKKLKSHPVCLTPEGYLSFEMEKYFAQIQPNDAPKADRVLELNSSHAMFQKLSDSYLTDPEKAKKYTELLYNQALLIAGMTIDDPSAYTDLVCELIN